jgi:hypothetical protein
MGWGNKVVKEDEPKIEAAEVKKHKRGRRSECIVRETKNVYRKAFSETQLLDILGVEDFKKGFSYHCISAGDVDSLSYLKVVLRQQKLDYLLFSTWCMAADDIMAIEEWLEDGTLTKVDAYLGEIFPKSYPFEWKKINEVFEKYNCGTISIFRNHSKVYAGIGDKYAFAIESSANINTNPRTEQTCISIDEGLYLFYKDYYSKINSFEK